MGCDIHLYLERKNGNRWERVPDPIRECWRCDGTGKYGPSVREEFIGKPCGLCDGTGKRAEHWYHNRNYNTFAILADVRNGHGFAGCDTGNGFNPIAMPRGIPGDVSESVAKEYYLRIVETEDEDGENECTRIDAERWGDPILNLYGTEYTPGPDWHSASWFTLAELLAYDWDQTTKHRGWVSLEQYREFRQNGKPSSWSGGVSGGSIKHISNAAMNAILDEDLTINGSPFTKVEWGESYRESASDFLKFLEELRGLGNPDELRIVFWFDN